MGGPGPFGYPFCHGNRREPEKLQVGMVPSLPRGAGRRGRFAGDFSLAEIWTEKLKRLGWVTLSGTSQPALFSQHFAALAWCVSPRSATAVHKQDYNTRRKQFISCWGEKKGSIHHSIYNTAKMSCQNFAHTHTKYCEQKNTRKMKKLGAWRGTDVA